MTLFIFSYNTDRTVFASNRITGHRLDTMKSTTPQLNFELKTEVI